MFTRRTLLIMAAGGAGPGGSLIVSSHAATPRSYACEQWDVFTSTPLSGNPLAVFLDARGLTADDMLSLARETNLSETTFIFPRDPATESQRGFRVRIFTREQELPFAGHPVLGTATAIRTHLPNAPATVRLDLDGGIIPVDFESTPQGAYGEMLQPEPIFAETHPVAAIAPLLALNNADFDAAFPIRNISTGRPNLIVMLKSLDAVKRAQVDWPAAQRYFASGDKQRGFYLLTRETEHKTSRVHARKPARAGDDPVTGSAAGCAAAFLVENGLAKSAERVIIEQGSEVHRPGELHVSAVKNGSSISTVRVGGYAVRVFEGRATW
jgi:trans-2,3-dihydro-3-hydroxyanthranilate isomerase